MKRFVLLLASALALIATTRIHSAQADEPAVHETDQQRDARLAWWREARFGMFIHWGPVSLKGTEISWSRAAPRQGCPSKSVGT
ncbi:MAG TPA: alpha-L-fucosidase, partial [Pirellulales bacterium]